MRSSPTPSPPHTGEGRPSPALISERVEVIRGHDLARIFGADFLQHLLDRLAVKQQVGQQKLARLGGVGDPGQLSGRGVGVVVIVLPELRQPIQTGLADHLMHEDVGALGHLGQLLAVVGVARDHHDLVGRRDAIAEGRLDVAMRDVEGLDLHVAILDHEAAIAVLDHVAFQVSGKSSGWPTPLDPTLPHRHCPPNDRRPR